MQREWRVAGGDVPASVSRCGPETRRLSMTWKTKGLIGAAAALSLVAGIGVALITPSSPACAAAAKISFAQDIMPIFRGRCVGCHQPGGEGFEKSGLDLTTYEGVMKGTKHGSMV